MRKKDTMTGVSDQLKAQAAVCGETFKRIEQALSYISQNIEEHKQGSEERHNQMRKLITDVEVIKTNLTNHLQHHTELKQEFQWKTGITVGIITLVISIGVNVSLKMIFG